MPTNLQVLLDHRPTDTVSPANFRIVEAPVGAPGPGEVLVRHQFLSLDPAMRPMLDDVRSYQKPQEVGGVMRGRTVGIVEASNNPRFQPGDAVQGEGGWQRFSLSDGRDLTIVDAKAIPLQAYLGPLGLPGVTAWYGVSRLIAPKRGETVLVSAATGAVGSSSDASEWKDSSSSITWTFGRRRSASSPVTSPPSGSLGARRSATGSKTRRRLWSIFCRVRILARCWSG